MSTATQPRTGRTPFGLRRQVRLLVPLIGTWVGAGLALVIASTQPWTSLRQLFLDAAYLGGQPWYTGILNKASFVGWTAGGTAAAFGAWIAHRGGRRGAARFLAGGAAVAAMLLIDVWVQFHSSVAPKVLGLDSNAAEIGQALIGGAWVVREWREIGRTRWLVLLAAFGALGVSAGVDIVFDPHGTAGLLLEDGMRLLGVLTFTHYLILTTIDITRSVVDDTRR